MTSPSRAFVRWTPVAARAGYGLFLVVAPEHLLDRGKGEPPVWAAPVARVLGVRHLLQAAALAARPQLAGPGGLVDLAHASTDLACAAVRSDLRLPPLLDAGIATVLAAASLASGSEGSTE